MIEPSAHQRSTKLAPSGRIVFSKRPESRPLLQQIAHNEESACDHKGCGRARYKLGRFCRAHQLNYEATGHPNGPSIRRTTWAAPVATAASFVNAQLRAGHPGIEAAVRWCASELHPQGVVVSRSDPRRPHRGYAAALTRARRAGVEPTELLARAIAAELADDRGEAARPMFCDDTHRLHQGARLFLYELPIVTAGWARRRRDHSQPAPPAIRIRWKVREYAHRRVSAAIGLLVLRAADEIKRRLVTANAPPDTPHDPVEGSAIPFTHTQDDPHD